MKAAAVVILFKVGEGQLISKIFINLSCNFSDKIWKDEIITASG